MKPGIFYPQWPIPDNVGSAISTRCGGLSPGQWSSFNLAQHVGDNKKTVAANRLLLMEMLELTQPPVWLQQEHGTKVICLDELPENLTSSSLKADAVVTRKPGLPCTIMTADCLPVLLCDRAGTVVAACHAGWRGLAAGILRNTINAMDVPVDQLLAYLGPAISLAAFEVGIEVKSAFMESALNREHLQAINESFQLSGSALQADMYRLANAELKACGVSQSYGGQYCTYTDKEQWFSYRRDGVTGRMASLIWLKEEQD